MCCMGYIGDPFKGSKGFRVPRLGFKALVAGFRVSGWALRMRPASL